LILKIASRCEFGPLVFSVVSKAALNARLLFGVTIRQPLPVAILVPRRASGGSEMCFAI
jgi:hypothetical protein